ncbi:hypothetical protein D3C86_2225140 [compost metagenome]
MAGTVALKIRVVTPLAISTKSDVFSGAICSEKVALEASPFRMTNGTAIFPFRQAEISLAPSPFKIAI